MISESITITQKQAALIYHALISFQQEGEAFLNGWTILPPEEGGALDIEMMLETHADMVEIQQLKDTLKDCFNINDNEK